MSITFSPQWGRTFQREADSLQLLLMTAIGAGGGEKILMVCFDEDQAFRLSGLFFEKVRRDCPPSILKTVSLPMRRRGVPPRVELTFFSGEKTLVEFRSSASLGEPISKDLT